MQMMELVMRGISQSAINVYRECPYAWYFRYIKEKQPMFWDQSVLDVGSQVHDAIDQYYKIRYLKEATADDILLEVYDILKRKWDTTLLPSQLLKAYTCLQNFSKWEHKNLLGNRHIKPLTEVKLDEEGFFGILDYVDPYSSTAIDWKTNTKPSISRNYKIQAAIYKVLYESKYKKPLSHFKFFFLYPNEIKDICYDNNEMDILLQEAVQQKNDIVYSYENNEFSKRPQLRKSCKNCLYRFYCIMREKDEKSNI